jgi:hypothetical protein
MKRKILEKPTANQPTSGMQKHTRIGKLKAERTSQKVINIKGSSKGEKASQSAQVEQQHLQDGDDDRISEGESTNLMSEMTDEHLSIVESLVTKSKLKESLAGLLFDKLVIDTGDLLNNLVF